VTDGGLHHHLAASGNFGQVIRKNYPVAIGNPADATVTELASVVGPLCTPLDPLADRMQLAQAGPGDLVVVFQSGAYGASASPQGFSGNRRVSKCWFSAVAGPPRSEQTAAFHLFPDAAVTDAGVWHVG
jgi:diaminopimelate decarboxylase